MNAEASSVIAHHLTVRGLVQGVGFRPFVYRLARRFGLSGSVANNADGVHIHLRCSDAALNHFIRLLWEEAPPAARISRIEQRGANELPADGFIILPSEQGAPPSTAISPDIATCAECEQEIADPANRRYRYPFTNCTNCGPRFSIVSKIPYDRPNTSMRVFSMCAQCLAEYEDPSNRRFHAQPNACPVCGPRLSWLDARGAQLAGDPIIELARALASDQVVAMKGLGGFHLAVNASSASAVAKLRQRKGRAAKPFAIMTKHLAAACNYARISLEEAALLQSPQRPIVLLAQHPNAPIADNVAPGLGLLGLMLPYTPLHHLLFAEADTPSALVMTSGNASDSPICIDNDEALRRLCGLADYFLMHDRDIVTRVDDSVLRLMAEKPRFMRRARGYAPSPVQLTQPCGDILACGAELKNTFCFIRGGEAYLSQHIGDLSQAEHADFYQQSIDHLQSVLQTPVRQTACDPHPDYISSRYARRLDLPCLKVQHHHAHAAAVLAEHGLNGPALSLVLDGAGYGDEGRIYGGEAYQVDRWRYVRLGHLVELGLPGGDMAARQPWRMAMSLLYQVFGKEALRPDRLPEPIRHIAAEKRQVIAQLLEKGFNCPPSSSCGRLFDAVSALLGLCLVNEYEGQAAMLLEHQASQAQAAERVAAYPVRVVQVGGCFRVEVAGMAAAVLADLAAHCAPACIAARFHGWLIASCISLLKHLQAATGLEAAVLSGGCMHNKILFEGLQAGLSQLGFKVYSGELAPMNDGGLSLGQAYIGGAACV